MVRLCWRWLCDFEWLVLWSCWFFGVMYGYLCGCERLGIGVVGCGEVVRWLVRVCGRLVLWVCSTVG